MAGIGLIGRLSADAALVRARFETLNRQVATGRRGELYGDIAPEARRAIDLRAEIGRREAQGAMLDRALGRIGIGQQALMRLGAIAEEFFAETVRLTPSDPGRLPTVAARARDAMAEVAQLLNTRHEGEYVFGGSDLANPPVADAANIGASGMAAQIAMAVGGLAAGTGGAVVAATLAAASSDAPGVTPFSAFLSGPGLTEPRRSLPAAGEGERMEYGLFANRNAVAPPSAAADSTGSWSRDLLRGLAVLSSLTPAQAAFGADYTQVVDSVREGLRGAVASIGEEAGILGATEKRLEAARTRHTEISDALAEQLAGAEEVDLAETITRLQATQARLEASYRALSGAGDLSLASFLR